MATRLAKPLVAEPPPPLPLCVDLDGTLVRTDLLHEAAVRFVASNPLSAWRLAVWALRGPLVLKRELAARVALDAAALCYRDELVAHIAAHRAAGASAYLVTASPRRWAEAVAAHLGVFDGVSATSDALNLKGAAKADALVARFGRGGFRYVGNDRNDVPVWAVAGAASGAGRAAARHLPSGAQVFGDAETAFAAIVRALRPHQWLKNLLLFVPLLTSHRIDDLSTNLAALAAFLAFCCCASSAYLVNDLIDLSADRAHPRKRLRPFASGAAPLWTGVVLAPLLVLVAALLCLATTPLFAALLAIYYVLTQAYSMTLKRRAPADIFTLAGLYTIRVLAGAAAIAAPLSLWLAAFSIFIFLSLAALKRHAELVDVAARGMESAGGRGYWIGDGPVLVGTGLASGFCAVLVLTLYVEQPHVAGLYRTPALLWLICPLLLYWLSRMWLLAQRRQMQDDPIVFAVRDAVSRNIIILCGAVAAAATLVEAPLSILVL